MDLQVEQELYRFVCRYMVSLAEADMWPFFSHETFFLSSPQDQERGDSGDSNCYGMAQVDGGGLPTWLNR